MTILQRDAREAAARVYAWRLMQQIMELGDFSVPGRFGHCDHGWRLRFLVRSAHEAVEIFGQQERVLRFSG